MKECESNILTEQFLNLKDQIFGKIDGDVVLEVKNPSALDGIKTLKSTVNFAIDNGKMPKLGSLEYLLRAGNILRSGLFGLSLNNLIQILAPYKTGEFEKISGDISIKGGEVENINIYSQGKNLSMYLTGEYSIFDNFANVMIYGKLSQTISNALGSVGNASLSQVINSITKDEKNKKQLQENFEKIPVLENENQNPKYFKAKIIGDINKDNYINNFSWE